MVTMARDVEQGNHLHNFSVNRPPNSISILHAITNVLTLKICQFPPPHIFITR